MSRQVFGTCFIACCCILLFQNCSEPGFLAKDFSSHSKISKVCSTANYKDIDNDGEEDHLNSSSLEINLGLVGTQSSNSIQKKVFPTTILSFKNSAHYFFNHFNRRIMDLFSVQ